MEIQSDGAHPAYICPQPTRVTLYGVSSPSLSRSHLVLKTIQVQLFTIKAIPLDSFIDELEVR